MVKELIKYTDFDGVYHEDEYYFNLSKPELGRLELKYKNGLEAELQRMSAEDDRQAMGEFLESIIISSYGVKTPDGKGFMKDKEKTKEFEYSIAYSELYGTLFTDESRLAAFVQGVVPAMSNVPAPTVN